MMTSQIWYRKSSIDQHTFQFITSKKCTGWKSAKLKTQNLLRTTNPENISSIGQILLKISFLKSKTNSFWKNEFWTYSSKNLSQNKTLIPKIQIQVKNKNSIFYRIFRCTPALSRVPKMSPTTVSWYFRLQC